MIDKVKLTNSLAKLEKKLRGSGKKDTANFFRKSLAAIVEEQDNDKLRKLLEQICSSGAMMQYANFTFEEEKLFEECFNESTKLLLVIEGMNTS